MQLSREGGFMNGFRDNCAYNVGLYIRLSREDDEKIDESISIKNQRTFLEGIKVLCLNELVTCFCSLWFLIFS